MALATQCPHCNTMFRVAADQLKLRGGIVRCGSCKEIFDGNAALLDPDAPAPAAPPGAARIEPAAAAPGAASAERAAATAEQPSEARNEAAIALDFDVPADSFDALLKQVQELTEPGEEMTFDLDLDVDIGDEGASGTAAQFEAGPAPAYDLKPVAGFAPIPEPEFELEAEPAPQSAPQPEFEARPAMQFMAEPEIAPQPAPEPERQPQPPFASAPRPEPGPLPRPEPLPKPAPLLEPEPLPKPELPPKPEPEPEPEPEPIFAPVAAAAPPPAAAYKEVSALYGHDDRREPSFDTELDEPDEYIVALAPPAPAGESAANAARPADAAPVEAAHVKAAPPEPGFVKQSRRRRDVDKALQILMGVGSAVLLIVFLAQALTTLRNQLAAQFPQLKPALETACAVLGCQIELPAQIDMLTVEQGELQAMTDNTFSYMTVLHNQSPSAQAWPSLELILNDANDKQVLRRVVTPGEYLGAAAEPDKGFAARAEQPVKLYFELAQLKASGYHIAVFYP